MAATSTPQTITVRLRVTLEVDVETYQLEYGTPLEAIPGDVDDYAVELFSQCAAANSGAWKLTATRQLAR